MEEHSSGDVTLPHLCNLNPLLLPQKSSLPASKNSDRMKSETTQFGGRGGGFNVR